MEVPTLSHETLLNEETPEGSTAIRERILQARLRQASRFPEKIFPARGGSAFGGKTNHSLRPKELKQHCRLDGAGQRLVAMAIRELGLSARAYFKILKIARTIADLAECEQTQEEHIAEAIQYRTLDRNWFG